VKVFVSFSFSQADHESDGVLCLHIALARGGQDSMMESGFHEGIISIMLVIFSISNLRLGNPASNPRMCEHVVYIN